MASIVDGLKNAIRGGNGPSIASEKSIAKSSAAHAEIEGRRAAAVQVVEGLREEENEAERAVADAKKDVEAAVKDVLKAEAIALAAAWRPLDAAARAARARLGRYHGPVHRLLTSSPRSSQPSPKTRRASLISQPSAMLTPRGRALPRSYCKTFGPAGLRAGRNRCGRARASAGQQQGANGRVLCAHKRATA